ncbi:MAG: hypothetical protein K0R39_38 [Symbiobacteriaceae bacterium]|jgi:hypothetical protein|nr:hypothetical protein [Symbiobacteriaceae bacterium]
MAGLVYRVGFQLGITVLLLGLLVMPFVKRGTPEFVVNVLGVLFAAAFLGLMWYAGRRQAKKQGE